MAFKRFTIEEGNRDLSIFVKWRSSKQGLLFDFLFALLFCLVWPIYFLLIIETRFHFVMHLLMLPIGIVGLFLLYNTISETFNTTKVVFSKEKITLDYGPFPILGLPFFGGTFIDLDRQKEFFKSEIKDIYIVQTRHKMSRSYRIQKTLGLKLKEDEDKTLLTSYSKFDLDWEDLQGKIEKITQKKVVKIQFS